MTVADRQVAQQTPDKQSQPDLSPTSVFDMLNLNSPTSSVATTPGVSPWGVTPVAAVPQSIPTRRSGRARPPQGAAPTARAQTGGLPPPCRERFPLQPLGAAPLPQPGAASASQPWWQAGATAAMGHLGQGRQPSCELPPLPRAPSVAKLDADDGCPTPVLFGHPQRQPRGGRRRHGHNGGDAGAALKRQPSQLLHAVGPPPQLPMLRLERTSSMSSEGSFSHRRSDSGLSSSDLRQGGSARSSEQGSFKLIRQRSGRGSFDMGRPRPLDRTSSLNEAKVSREK